MPTPRWTSSNVLTQLRTVYTRHGHPLTLHEWQQYHYQPSPATIYSLFGSWPAAWAQAGHPISRHQRAPHWTPDRILQALHDHLDPQGHLPTSSQWQALGYTPNIATIRKHWGSYARALTALQAQYPTLSIVSPRPRAITANLNSLRQILDGLDLTRLFDPQDQQWIRQFLTGDSFTDIARRAQCSREYVRQRLTAYRKGIPSLVDQCHRLRNRQAWATQVLGSPEIATLPEVWIQALHLLTQPLSLAGLSHWWGQPQPAIVAALTERMEWSLHPGTPWPILPYFHAPAALPQPPAAPARPSAPLLLLYRWYHAWSQHPFLWTLADYQWTATFFQAHPHWFTDDLRPALASEALRQVTHQLRLARPALHPEDPRSPAFPVS